MARDPSCKTLMSALFVALQVPLVAWMADASIAVEPALAQTQAAEPLARLADLARRKGDANSNIGQICANFGVTNQVQKCRTYQLDHEEGQLIPSFNVLMETPGETIIIIIRHVLVSDTDKSDVAQVYLTGVDGKLRKALSGKHIGKTGDKNLWDWWTVSINDPQIRSGFAKEVSFWQAHVEDVDRNPDAWNK